MEAIRIAVNSHVQPKEDVQYLSAFSSLLISVVWLAASLTASAQSYPSKPIRIIVPYAAGGTADVQARIVADSMVKQLGQPVIVDNRPGASAAIGHKLLSQSSPDGYTIGMLTTAVTVLPAMMANWEIDPAKGFTPITQYNRGEYAIVVSNAIPATTLPDLLRYARDNSGKFNIGVAGGHIDLVATYLGERAKIPWTVVRYKGSAPVRLALLSGEVTAAIEVPGYAKEMDDAGKLRFIAVTGAQRGTEWPAIPAVEEKIPGFEASFWWGFAGPRGLPSSIVKTLNGAIRHAVQTPAVQEALRRDGAIGVTGTPEDLERLMASYAKEWGGIARKFNITQ